MSEAKALKLEILEIQKNTYERLMDEKMKEFEELVKKYEGVIKKIDEITGVQAEPVTHANNTLPSLNNDENLLNRMRKLQG
jgi:hypothetical protein